jgi:hypothetical protein
MGITTRAALFPGHRFESKRLVGRQSQGTVNEELKFDCAQRVMRRLVCRAMSPARRAHWSSIPRPQESRNFSVQLDTPFGSLALPMGP